MNKYMMICFALAIMIVGCKKVEVDFTFSPTEPKAGQLVKFSNHSSEGEDWSWDFGDKTTSVLKNPHHTFTKPGTYTVTLMVDSAKYNTYSRTITVYDTVPSFVASTDSICHYTDVVLTANVYNPYGYKLTYAWDLPENCVITSGTLTDKVVVQVLYHLIVATLGYADNVLLNKLELTAVALQLVELLTWNLTHWTTLGS